ncbi:MAG: hypothetical protein NTX75_01735 [Proteobacteria bacterium]|nr:hypothetical protein [Pseudomonadota bacterium]
MLINFVQSLLSMLFKKRDVKNLKIADAYFNGSRHFNELLGYVYQQEKIYEYNAAINSTDVEAFGFELPLTGTSLEHNFFIFSRVEVAEEWASGGGLPNNRAIIPLYLKISMESMRFPEVSGIGRTYVN